ncbi:MTH1187/YkoF-like protein [Elaphomyces granulatus]
MSSPADPESMPSIPTPSHCTADFCLIPIGTSSASVSAQIADVQRLIQKSGLSYVMHSAGTTLGTYIIVQGHHSRNLEISYPGLELPQVIGQAHTMLHQQGILRIQSDIRVGSRTDKHQTFEDKVRAVERLLEE